MVGRLEAPIIDPRLSEVKAAWTGYQEMIAAYRHRDPTAGRALLQTLIDTAGHDIPATLAEIRALARTLKR